MTVDRGVLATRVTGEGAEASLNVSFCFFWPLSSGQSLLGDLVSTGSTTLIQKKRIGEDTEKWWLRKMREGAYFLLVLIWPTSPQLAHFLGVAPAPFTPLVEAPGVPGTDECT